MAVKNPLSRIVAIGNDALSISEATQKAQARANKIGKQVDVYYKGMSMRGKRIAVWYRTVRPVTSNPQTAFPKGKFVKVQAIRVNRDGTVTVKK